MSVVDIDKIINGTPEKVIEVAYRKMHDNYNQDSALEFKDAYSKLPINDVINCSRKIFSEPFYGYDFYKSIVCSPYSCLFEKLTTERAKLQEYMDDNSSMMPETMKTMYAELIEKMDDTINKVSNSMRYSTSFNDKCDPSVKDEIIEKINSFNYDHYNEDCDSFCELISSDKIPPDMLWLYAPYICAITDNNPQVCSTVYNKIGPIEKWMSKLSDKEDVSKCIRLSVMLNHLKDDEAFINAVRNLSHAGLRDLYNFLINKITIKDIIDHNIATTECDHVSMESGDGAVNSIFDEIASMSIFNEEVNEVAKYNASLKLEALDAEMEFVANDMIYNEDASTTYEELQTEYNKINDKYHIVTEESDNDEDDDLSDEDIENLQKEIDNDVKSDKSDKKEDKDDKKGDSDTGKKPQAPKPKNLANKIQFKSMDNEAARNEKLAIAKQKGQEIKNAAKQVSKLPLNILNSIKDVAHKIDTWDDERRKNYYSEPGFRKKLFRNLKLAILYGSAASYKLSMIPVVMMARHFSKEKNIRMQNELKRELDTEIKVCEEKISDANANGDNKEKYRLMRIKDQLTAEMARVAVNSKYV